MRKQDIIKIANENNSNLYLKIIKENEIPTAVIDRFVEEGLLTKADRDVYITDQGVEDELFINSIKYSWRGCERNLGQFYYVA